MRPGKRAVPFCWDGVAADEHQAIAARAAATTLARRPQAVYDDPSAWPLESHRSR